MPPLVCRVLGLWFAGRSCCPHGPTSGLPLVLRALRASERPPVCFGHLSPALGFATQSFLHLHASFAGLVGLFNARFPSASLDCNDRARVLEHGWLLFGLVDARLPHVPGTAVDLRVEHLDRALDQAAPAFRAALDQQARDHSCRVCAKTNVLIGDGCWKATTKLCNERSMFRWAANNGPPLEACSADSASYWQA